MGLSSCMEPLTLYCPSIFRVDSTAIGKMLLVSFSLSLVTSVLVLPQIDILWENKDALCAGNVNFVYGESAGLATWAESVARDDESDFRPWRWPKAEVQKM